MTSAQTYEALAARVLANTGPDALLEEAIAEACGWTREGYWFKHPTLDIRLAGAPKFLSLKGHADWLLPSSVDYNASAKDITHFALVCLWSKRVPRPKSPIPITRLEIKLPTYTVDEVKRLLPRDGRTGDPRYGAMSDLVHQLLSKWVDERRIGPAVPDPFTSAD